MGLERANVVLFSHDEDDVELGTSAEEKGKIDSKVETTNNDNDFVKFKVHENDQSHREKVSYVVIPIWQVIHYHFFTLQDDHLVRSRFYNCKCYDFERMQDFICSSFQSK